MTVGTLIKYLKELPQDAVVVDYAPKEQGYTGGYNSVQAIKFLRMKEKTDFMDGEQGEYSGEWICEYAKCQREVKGKIKEGDKLGIMISATDYIIEK